MKSQFVTPQVNSRNTANALVDNFFTQEQFESKNLKTEASMEVESSDSSSCSSEDYDEFPTKTNCHSAASVRTKASSYNHFTETVHAFWNQMSQQEKDQFEYIQRARATMNKNNSKSVDPRRPSMNYHANLIIMNNKFESLAAKMQ